MHLRWMMYQLSEELVILYSFFFLKLGNIQSCRSRHATSRQDYICYPAVQNSPPGLTKVREEIFLATFDSSVGV